MEAGVDKAVCGRLSWERDPLNSSKDRTFSLRMQVVQSGKVAVSLRFLYAPARVTASQLSPFAQLPLVLR